MILLEVKKTRTTPYRPSSNDLIERFNSTLSQRIKMFVDKIWVYFLRPIEQHLIQLPVTVQTCICLAGRSICLVISFFHFQRSDALADVHEYVIDLRDQMVECYHLVQENLKSAAERQKRDYDSRALEYKYKPGDAVYKKEGAGRKLEEKYTGHFLVTKSHSPSLCYTDFFLENAIPRRRLLS